MSFPERQRELEGVPLGPPIDRRRNLAMGVSLRFAQMRARQQREENNRYVAFHDSLTGLPNATAFKEAFEGGVKEAHRKNEPLGLAVIDLDSLKAVNDTLGHDSGNSYIKSVVKALQASIRQGGDNDSKQDTIFRLTNGDELAILMPGYVPDAKKGQTQAELDELTTKRLRGGVDSALEEIGEFQQIIQYLGVSIGIGTLQPRESTDEFFERVDRTLYIDKKARKDKRDRQGIEPIIDDRVPKIRLAG